MDSLAFVKEPLELSIYQIFAQVIQKIFFLYHLPPSTLSATTSPSTLNTSHTLTPTNQLVTS